MNRGPRPIANRGSTDMLHADGTLHFSDLKRLAISAAHFAAGMKAERETTKAMRLGTLVDMALLTTKRPLVAGKTRKDAAFHAMQARHPFDDVYTQPELEESERIVDAFLTAPFNEHARDVLGMNDPDRRTQVPLKWETTGVPRSTRGVDVITRGRLVDLKVTNSTSPEKFVWHAKSMLWHCQLTDYLEACEQNGIAITDGLYLVGIESSPPYVATALRLTEGAIDDARKKLSMWIGKYRNCAAANEWPGYTQCDVDLDVVTFAEAIFEDEDASDEDAA